MPLTISLVKPSPGVVAMRMGKISPEEIMDGEVGVVGVCSGVSQDYGKCNTNVTGEAYTPSHPYPPVQDVASDSQESQPGGCLGEFQSGCRTRIHFLLS